MTFEDKMKKLEMIVATLEKGECPLDEAMALFQQGVALSKDCHSELEKARQLITSIDDEELPEA